MTRVVLPRLGGRTTFGILDEEEKEFGLSTSYWGGREGSEAPFIVVDLPACSKDGTTNASARGGEREGSGWWGRTALCLAQHDHLHWSFFTRVDLLFRLDLLFDLVICLPCLGLLRFALGTLLRILLGGRGKHAGERINRVL